MKSPAKTILRSILIILALIIVIFLLTLGIEKVIRELVVIPISYLSWLARSLINSFPQDMLWGILIFVLLVVAYRSLKWKTAAGKPFQEHPLEKDVRFINTHAISAITWLQRIQLVEQHLYSRSYFNRHITNLFMEVEAFHQHCTERAVKESLQQGNLPLTPELRQFILEQEENNHQSEEGPWFARLWGWLSHQAAHIFKNLPRQDIHAITKSEAQMIAYLETELEINDAHRNE